MEVRMHTLGTSIIMFMNKKGRKVQGQVMSWIIGHDPILEYLGT
jgi:hypothetical protein